jgi:hypothetical protein
MPVREMTPQEVSDWLGSGRVLFRARPPVSSAEKPTGSSETPKPGLPQDLLEQMYQVFEAGFRAQDAYQMELQRQSATDGSLASPPPTGDSQDEPGLEQG